MSSIYGLQQQAQLIEQTAKDVLRDLRGVELPNGVRTMIEVIESEARVLDARAENLRSAFRPLIDG